MDKALNYVPYSRDRDFPDFLETPANPADSFFLACPYKARRWSATSSLKGGL